MKTFFNITLLIILFSLSHFSQDKNHRVVLPDKPTSERPREIHKPNVDGLPGFEVIESLLLKSKSNDWQTALRNPQKEFYEEGFNAKDSRITINKTLLGNGFLLIEALFQNWNGSAWMISGKSSYIYDMTNNLIEHLSQTWDGSSWVNSLKSSYTYDENNNLTERLSQRWVNSSWINFGKYSYTYEGNNNWTEVLYQIWNNSSWENRGKYLYIYDGNNYLVEQLNKTWDGFNWLDEYKIIYNYDGNNNLIETLWKLWDGYAWLISSKSSYTYDGNNNQIEILSQRWDGSAWVNSSKSSFTYDGNNNLAELLFQMWNISTWVNSSKYLYAYVPVTEVNENLSSINSYSLSNNYPNPFNPSTRITYSTPERSNVSLKVYNLLGSEVAELVKGEIEAGTYDITFNASNLPSGVYFYQLKTENYIETKKMILMR